MSRYVLGLRRAGAQTDEAMLCRTAGVALQAVEAWVGDRGTVTAILRAGKPITEHTLCRDVGREKRRRDARR